MSHKDDIENLLVEHRRHLQKLREQQAKLGLHTPPHILTEIEDAEATIEKLQTEWNEITSQGTPEPSTPEGLIEWLKGVAMNRTCKQITLSVVGIIALCIFGAFVCVAFQFLNSFSPISPTVASVASFCLETPIGG